MTRNSMLTALIAATFAVIALPAAAGQGDRSPDGFVMGAEEGGWSLEQHAYGGNEGRRSVAASQPVARVLGAANDPFDFIGGDTGWELKQHKYDFAGGRLAMSDECDHVIRTAAAPTPAEVEKGRTFSPGA